MFSINVNNKRMIKKNLFALTITYSVFNPILIFVAIIPFKSGTLLQNFLGLFIQKSDSKISASRFFRPNYAILRHLAPDRALAEGMKTYCR